MNNEIRYDEIKWACVFNADTDKGTQSYINVFAFDLETQLPITRKMTFKEVLGMITDDGNGNHIDVTQEVLKFESCNGEINPYEHPETIEQSHKFGAYAFFAEITGRENDAWMTTETIKEYNDKVTQAISDLLEGKKKLLSLNEI